MPVSRAQPEINAENFLASTSRAQHKVGWFDVSVNNVTEHVRNEGSADDQQACLDGSEFVMCQGFADHKMVCASNSWPLVLCTQRCSLEKEGRGIQ